MENTKKRCVDAHFEQKYGCLDTNYVYPSSFDRFCELKAKKVIPIRESEKCGRWTNSHAPVVSSKIHRKQTHSTCFLATLTLNRPFFCRLVWPGGGADSAPSVISVSMVQLI